LSYTSINIEPNGSKPPKSVITKGSVYHFFSGIGLGTAFIRHGWFGWPLIALPSRVPIKLQGNITKTQIATIASYKKKMKHF
jgi:hypothetical protein